MNTFIDQVADEVFKSWQEDPIFPTAAESHLYLNDEEKFEFDEHVEDVLEFARQNGIRDARVALEKYTDSIKEKYTILLN